MGTGNNKNRLLRAFFVCVLASVFAYGISVSLRSLGLDLKVFNPISDLLISANKVDNGHDETGLLAETSHLSNRPKKDINTEETNTQDEHNDFINSTDDTLSISTSEETKILIDFSAEKDALGRLRDKLRNAQNESLHIAFFGDSFTEGDILVGDFRRMLQRDFGGKGVGYVPATSPTARFRTTIKHRYSGDWKPVTLLHSGTFTTSGRYDKLNGVGNVSYTMTSRVGSNSEVDKISIIYESEAPTSITTTLNDTLSTTYQLVSTGSSLLSILREGIEGSSIKSFSFKAESEDLRIHGVYLDGSSGVSVDNISMRGASGGELTRIKEELYSQMRDVRNYQVVIISFGLNALSVDDNNDEYYWYYKKLKKSIQHLKNLCPEAVFLILSVSDRATLVDGKVVTLPAVYKVRQHQKQLAREEECLFWDTFSVVKSFGGIETMVEKGWAAKDYTHLSGAGGRQLATKLYESLVKEQ